MCPNPDCEKHRQPTSLMGGCDRGEKLVPYKTEEQETREALWDLMPARTKRLITHSLLGRMHDEQTKGGA